MGWFSDLEDKAKAWISGKAYDLTGGMIGTQSPSSSTQNSSDQDPGDSSTPSASARSNKPDKNAKDPNKTNDDDADDNSDPGIIGNLIKAVMILFKLLAALAVGVGGLLMGLAGLGGNKSSDVLQKIGNVASETWNNIKQSGPVAAADQLLGNHVLAYTAPQATADVITNAATSHHIDPLALLTVSKIESNWNPNAVNPTTQATGLFQFMSKTADKVGHWWNRKDPVANANYAAELWNENKTTLQQSLGRSPSDAELYLAWQQGAGGAGALLKHANDGMPAWQALMDTAAYRNKPELAKKAVVGNGGSVNMTAGEFASKWTSQYEKVHVQVANGSCPGGNSPPPVPPAAAPAPDQQVAKNHAPQPAHPHRDFSQLSKVSGPQVASADPPAPLHDKKSPSPGSAHPTDQPPI